MLNSTTFVKRRKKQSKFVLIAVESLIKLILVIYLIAGLIMISLLAENVFHKLNRFNLTEVDALVLGGDWEHTRVTDKLKCSLLFGGNCSL